MFKFIRNLFKSIKLYFNRKNNNSIPFTSANKIDGYNNEEHTYNYINANLKNAKIYKNVCLDNKTSKGEIDLLIIYENKVFIIEEKSWRGIISCDEDNFYQTKKSFQGEIYTNVKENPFKQIRRNLYLIKEKYPDIWFNPIVLFNNADEIDINSNDIYFDSLIDLINYIKNVNTIKNREYTINNLINTIKCYDTLYSKNNFLRCIIDEKSLNFVLDKKEIFKSDIVEINVYHHALYDDLLIKLKNNEIINSQIENKELIYIENNEKNITYFSKIDYIVIG